MSERSNAKRRRSTPPSPPNSDRTVKASSPSVRRPPRKKGRRLSPKVDSQKQESRILSVPDPSTQGQSVSAQPEQVPSAAAAANPSTQYAFTPRHGSIMQQEFPAGTPERVSAARPGASQSKPSGQRMDDSESAWMMLQNDQSRALEEEPFEMPGQESLSAIDDYIFDSMSFSPYSFSPAETWQGDSQNSVQHAGGPLEMPFTMNPQASVPSMPNIAPIGPIYHTMSPGTERVPFAQQIQAQQFPASSHYSALLQAYPVPEEVQQTSQAQAPASQVPMYLPGGGQPDYLSPATSMPAGQLQPMYQPTQVEQSSQPTALSAQAGGSSHRPGNFIPTAHHSAELWQRTLDPAAEHPTLSGGEQQARANYSPTGPGAPQHQSLNIPPYSDPGARHSWTVPPAPPQPPVIPQQQRRVAPQQSPPPPPQPNLPSPPWQTLLPPQMSALQPNRLHTLRQPSQPPIRQTPTTLHPHPPFFSPQPQPNNPSPPIPPPFIPIDPSITTESYLWTQLEVAQLTMVGTLAHLVMLAQNREVEVRGGEQQQQQQQQCPLEIEEGQVRNVTRNLVNVMSLWWLLRRGGESGV